MMQADLMNLVVTGAATAQAASKPGLFVDSINWFVLAPQIILAFTATVMMALDIKFWSKYKHWVGFAGAIGLALAALVGLRIPLDLMGSTFHGMVVFDGLAKTSLVLFCTLGLITFLMSRDYLNAQKMARGEYYILLMFSIIGMVIMTSTRELLTFFIALETISIPLYVLAGFSLYSRKSNEAGIKYLLLGAFGAGFLIYGVALMYGATGSLTFDGIQKVLAAGLKPGMNTLFQTGFVLFLVGMAFKISLVPFHMWTPDVYEGSPAPVTAFMGVGTKAAAIIGLMRFMDEAMGAAAPANLLTLIAVLAVLSMVFGNFGAVMQQNVKRMLAYSSIAHAGYLMVGLLAFGKAQAAVVYYMAAYMFMNMGAFGVLIALSRHDDEGLNVEDFQGLAYRRPALAAFMTLCMLGMAGIPPTVGFFSKFYLFGGAIGEGFYKVAAVGLLTSVVGVYYYLKVVVAMYMKPPSASAATQPYTMSPLLGIGIALSGIGILVAGIFPDQILGPVLKIIAMAP